MKLSPTTRRVLTAMTAIALLGIGGFAALWFAAQPSQPLAASPPEMSSTEEHAAATPSLRSLLMSDDLLIPSGATPLDGLPLNMPLYSGRGAGVEAMKLSAYQREDGEASEQVAIYSFRGFKQAELQEIQVFYNDQAHRLGFKPQPPPGRPDSAGSDSGSSKLYTRDDQVLLVRVRQAGLSIRLTILLRYTESR